MTDPRIAKLSEALAVVFVTLIDIANSGADMDIPETKEEPKSAEPDKPKATRARKTGEPSSVKPVEPIIEQEPEPETEASLVDDEAQTFTLEDAKRLVIQIVQTKGRDAAVALLTKYKAVKDGKPNAGNLAPDAIDAFCAAANAIVEAA